MKILITGGHMTPALAVIPELKKKKYEIVYIGRHSSFANGASSSVESEVIPDLGIKYYSINPPKLQRKLSFTNLLSLIRLPFVLVQCIDILFNEKPKVVLSFGSYVALPIAVAAYILRIPIITHEQTQELSLSTRIIGALARKIAISWPNQEGLPANSKVVLTGNPIRQELLIPRARTTKKIIYITGGNQGSHIINQALLEVVDQMVADFVIFHQTGQSPDFNDFEAAEVVKNKLDEKDQKNYLVEKWFDTSQVAEILSRAALVVGRSGANTVYEVGALGIPAIFIPISWSAKNEQVKNAEVLAESKSALIIPEKEISGKRLLTTINSLFEDYDEFEKNARQNKKLFATDAAEKIAELIQEVTDR